MSARPNRRARRPARGGVRHVQRPSEPFKAGDFDLGARLRNSEDLSAQLASMTLEDRAWLLFGLAITRVYRAGRDPACYVKRGRRGPPQEAGSEEELRRLIGGLDGESLYQTMVRVRAEVGS